MDARRRPKRPVEAHDRPMWPVVAHERPMWPVEAREGGQEVGEGGLGVGQTADSRNQVGGKGGGGGF